MANDDSDTNPMAPTREQLQRDSLRSILRDAEREDHQPAAPSVSGEVREALRTKLSLAPTVEARERNPFCGPVKAVDYDLYLRLMDALQASHAIPRESK